MAIVLVGVLAAWGSKSPPDAADQLPMYGGMDRSSNPILKGADERLIADTTKEFGSKEKASALFVEEGIRFYQRNDFVMAMRRYNQAWLLNPENPDVYWGFAMVYHDYGKPCDAMKMIDMALDHGLAKPIALADAGRIITLCSHATAGMSDEAQKSAYARSESMYTEAIAKSPNNDYILVSWATAYYWRGDYSAAWKKVAEARSAGGAPPAPFLNLLRARAPEPSQP